MQASAIDLFTRKTASALITTYQKQLSPRKGFSCAHRVLYGEESCSQYIKRTILEQGFGQALPLIRQRFQACKTANQILKDRLARQQSVNKPLAIDSQEASEDEQPQDDNQQNRPGRLGGGNFISRRATVANSSAIEGSGGNCSDCSYGSLDCMNLGCDALDCSGANCSNLDCGSMDCSSMDCSSMDCSSADCSNLDCGNCDFGSCS